MTNILYLLRGLPGAGKSTLAEAIADIALSADAYFESGGEYVFDSTRIKVAHEWCQNACENAMQSGISDIAIANTFTQEWELAQYYALAEKYGYDVFSLIVENRHGGENIHGVPETTLNKMRNRFQVKL